MKNRTIEGVPFWLKRGEAAQYNWLNKMEQCDLAVIGGGIAAAMLAYRAAKNGRDVVLLSPAPIGFNESLSSVGAAMEFGADGMTGLIDAFGPDEAVGIQRELKGAIEELAEIAGERIEFERCDSLFYSEEDGMREELNRELRARIHNGCGGEFLSAGNANKGFSFKVDCGVYSENSAAVIDPYALTHLLIDDAKGAGARIYENTKVVRTAGNAGSKVLYCDTKNDVIAAEVAVTTPCFCGESANVDIAAVYNVVSEPVEDFSGWKNRCVIQRKGKEEVTLRTVPDNRIIISGLKSCQLFRRMGHGKISPERFAQGRYTALEEMLREMFCGIRNIKPAFRYTTPVIETANGLYTVARSREHEGVYYALCDGRNVAVPVIMTKKIFEKAGREADNTSE